MLPGQSVLVNLSGEKAEAMVLRQPAALHLHMADPRPARYPASLMGTVAYVRQALYDAARYRDEWAAYERAPAGRKRPRYDAGSRRPGRTWLAGTAAAVVTASRENDVRRALALADEFKMRVIAGRTRPRPRALAALIKERKLPLLVGRQLRPAALPRFRRFGGPDDEKERRDIDEAERNPAALQQAGVSFALVSAYAPDFLAGVRKAIERGLPARGRAARAHPRRRGGAGSRRPAGQPGAGQDRERRGLVRRAADEGREGRRWSSWTASSTSPTRGQEPADAPKPPSPKPATAPSAPAAAAAPSRRCRHRDRPVAIVGGTILTVGPAGHDRERHRPRPGRQDRRGGPGRRRPRRART